MVGKIFKCFNLTTIGASHLERGVICQDYSGTCASDKYAVAIVSDGHGSKKHFRSDKGSKLAVDVTKEAIIEFMARENEFIEKLSSDYNGILTQLESNIVFRWNNAVTRHFRDNPLSAEEYAICIDEDIDINQPTRIYGATLIIGVLTDKYAFAIQIGDGVCVFVDKDYVPLIPIVGDRQLAFGFTTSICDSDAIKHFRHFYSENVPKGIILSTDGITDSYSLESFLAFNAKIIRSFDMGFNTAKDDLIGWLPILSDKGSRDDMSISCVFSAKGNGEYIGSGRFSRFRSKRGGHSRFISK